MRLDMLAVLPVLSISAQSITGSLTGTVTGPSGAVIVNAPLRPIQAATEAERLASASEAGRFFFGSPQRGEYKLVIEAHGFRRLERTAVNATAASGAPCGAGFSTVNATDITGSRTTDGPRVNITGNCGLSGSDRNFCRCCNTAVHTLPAVGTYGNAARTAIRLPGINNWDSAGYKNFGFGKERLRTQFRAEFYNAFSHTQYTNVDTAARFHAQGRQVNTQFGQMTATSSARRIQLPLRLTL